MRIGIIAEGRGDLAVLSNILRGWLGIDSEYIRFLRPENRLDETDLHEMSQRQFSNWGLVKQECLDGTLLEDFLNSPIDEERRVVIHIDTAEAELPGYDVRRHPDSDATELHKRVAAKLDEWLAGRGKGRIRHAIAVEETEAWTLTLYVEKETSTYRDPKKALERTLQSTNRLSEKQRKSLRQLKGSDAYKYQDELSREFRKRRTLKDCATRNHSLRLFLEALSQDVEQSG
ncbi:hypothetical protein [Archangium sp.]|uniref:hypothetical protein n=1 Tax=Archangium sp. TaxID=1872627 RepID=UPI002869FB62|nr:hypothetical protein [Archangium sp.]